jgi:hypothetical protein
LEDHWLAKHVDGFDLDSYNLGVVAAFAEVVVAGCKRLAFSAPLSPEQYARLKEPIELIAEENGVEVHADDDFLVTRLFNPVYTEGKIVVHIVKDPAVFEEYLRLKELKRRSLQSDVEEDVARGLGRLLSYDEGTIEELLRRPRF